MAVSRAEPELSVVGSWWIVPRGYLRRFELWGEEVAPGSAAWPCNLACILYEI